MHTSSLDYLHRHLFKLTLLGCCLIYCILTIPAIFQSNHFYKNLEPYPDGLLYANSAQNLIRKQQLALIYNSSSLQIWTPPLYPLVLSMGFLFSTNITSFYLVNVILGLCTFILFYYILECLGQDPRSKSIVLILFACHATWSWLPSLPMSENLSLPLFLSGVLIALQQRPKFHSILLLALIAILLLFTRYSMVTSSIFFFATCIYLWFKYKQIHISKNQFYLFTTAGLIALICCIMLNQLKHGFFEKIILDIFGGPKYFQIAFLPTNLQRYFGILIGHPDTFLWKTFSFTSIVITLTSSLGIFFQLSSKQARSQVVILLGILSSIFPLIILFYVVDIRYILTALPILIFSQVFFFDAIFRRWNKVIGLLFAILIFILVGYSQAPLFKEIVLSNIFHRSIGWQYEAIINFNKFANSSIGHEQIEIITALPPFLVGTYQTQNYKVLPLSEHQEFIAKKQYVWGDDVSYDNLIEGYKKKLNDGKNIYISNAYITHQQEVIKDFEEYKKNFQLLPVSSGCLNTCNIYQILLK